MARATSSFPVPVSPTIEAPAIVTPAKTSPVIAPAPAPDAHIAVTPAIAAPATIQPAAAPAAHNPTTAPAVTRLSSPPVQVAPTNQIETVTGDIYSKVYVEKVVSDGIIISYAPRNGAMAMTKIFFYELPKVLRQRYEPKPKDAGT